MSAGSRTSCLQRRDFTDVRAVTVLMACWILALLLTGSVKGATVIAAFVMCVGLLGFLFT